VGAGATLVAGKASDEFADSFVLTSFTKSFMINHCSANNFF
jgi:hypothetical protein